MTVLLLFNSTPFISFYFIIVVLTSIVILLGELARNSLYAWDFKSPLEFEKSLEGDNNFWAWYSSSFLFFVTVEPRDHQKLWQSFCPPIRPFAWTQFWLSVLSATSYLVLQWEEWLQIRQLPLQDSCISRILASVGLCFHSSLTALNRSYFHFI